MNKRGSFQFKYASNSNLKGGSLATLAFHQVTSSTGMLTHSKLTIEYIFDLLINHGDVGKEERNSYPARLNERSRFRFMLSLNTDCWHSYLCQAAKWQCSDRSEVLCLLYHHR